MSAPSLSVLADQVVSGRRILIPYVMAGATEDWLEVVDAVVDAGADAVEVGLPFSDPLIDGPVIQEAADRALAAGTTAAGVLAQLARRDVGAPLVAMTYYNVVDHLGLARFAGMAVEAGVSGTILADLSLEESGPWSAEADRSGIDTVMLVAPSTPAERTGRIVARSRGFTYAVARMGVTGERAELGGDVEQVVARVRAFPGPPVCVGIGVSTPEQAAHVGAVADGVIVGSALVRRVLAGEGPEGAAAFVSSLRQAL
jgi:tryptophan synthase alpha chain